MLKAIALFCLLLAKGAFAADYYVSTTGNDSNDGSSDTPFLTIQHAVDLAAAGDTINVRSGNYTYGGASDSFPVTLNAVGTQASPIILKSVGYHGAKLDGNALAHSYIKLGANARYWVIDGFEITGDRWAGVWSNNGAKNITVRNCYIHNIGNRSEATTVGMAGIFEDSASDSFIIEKNLIQSIGRTNATTGALTSLDHGIYANGSNHLISNNIFDDARNGWHIQTAAGFSGRIANNTFNGPNKSPSGLSTSNKIGQIMLWDTNSNLEIKNNIFNEPRTNAIDTLSSVVTSLCQINNNIAYSATNNSLGLITSLPTGCTQVDNQLNVNPSLGDPPTDISISSTGPAFDSGLTLSNIVDDYAGTSRPQGAAFDIGAYESPVAEPVFTVGGGSKTGGGSFNSPIGPVSSPDRLELFTDGSAIRRLVGSYKFYASTGTDKSNPSVAINGKTGEITANGVINANCGIKYGDGTRSGVPASGCPTGDTGSGSCALAGATCGVAADCCSGPCSAGLCGDGGDGGGCTFNCDLTGEATTYAEHFDVGMSTEAGCAAAGATFGALKLTQVDGTGCAKITKGSTSSYLDLATQAPINASQNFKIVAELAGVIPTLPYEFNVTLNTRKQNRTGASPAAIDRGQVLMQYQSSTQYYYFAPRSDGWELGKHSVNGDSPLVVIFSPVYPVGTTRRIKVKQDSSGTMSAYVNDQLLAVYQDTSPTKYTNGKVGVKALNSEVEITSVTYISGAGVSNPVDDSNVFITTYDVFGINKIYKDLMGGKTWTSQWKTNSRTITPGNADAYDPWSIVRGDSSYSIDGSTTGIVSVHGATERFYIVPGKNVSYGMRQASTQWRNIEATMYFRPRRSCSGIAYTGGSITLRTNHGVYTGTTDALSGETDHTAVNGTTYNCDTRGYHIRMRCDGNIDVVKETSHPDSPSQANTTVSSVWTPSNFQQWIGMKAIVYDLPNGNIQVEIWTDQSATNTWTKKLSFVDTGSNLGVGGTACVSGISPLLRIPKSGVMQGSRSGLPTLTPYFRFDSDSSSSDAIQYKYMTIREIGDTPVAN